jgi:cysteinyl-tRNA synthetase
MAAGNFSGNTDMPITLYNTLSGRKELLKPQETNRVTMYVCGITAYDYCHIGHARSVLAFDMIYRYLQYRGFQVTYIRNFTDIDDKIIKRANELGTSSEELANRFIDAFHEDMARLRVASPTMEPKATEHVDEIIELIVDLVAKGYAYQVGNDVYYSVEKFAGYGKLSGRSLDDMKAGARISVNENKNNPMDFALWKASKPGEPSWESPWGAGRPGWHIECSAMSRKYLGNSFDIHGGGKDLIFPHHENEIAQSEAASGAQFVTMWVHHGFVTIKDEKMSKSLGNFLTIREVLERFEPEVLRLFVFSTHYRNPLDYSEAAMQDAEAGLDRLYNCLAESAQLPRTGGEGKRSAVGKQDRQKIASLRQRFQAAMDNDFNSALALGHLFEAVKILNKITHNLPAVPAADDLAFLTNGAAMVRELAGIMGLISEDPVAYVTAKQARLLRELNIDQVAIEKKIRERTEARENRDWAKSDAIRDKLLAKHIELKDGPTGTTWRIKR